MTFEDSRGKFYLNPSWLMCIETMANEYIGFGFRFNKFYIMFV